MGEDIRQRRDKHAREGGQRCAGGERKRIDAPRIDPERFRHVAILDHRAEVKSEAGAVKYKESRQNHAERECDEDEAIGGVARSCE